MFTNHSHITDQVTFRTQTHSWSSQVERVEISSPASEAGLKVRDFLVSVQGKEVLDLTHQQVVKLIKGAGPSLNLSIER